MFRGPFAELAANVPPVRNVDPQAALTGWFHLGRGS